MTKQNLKNKKSKENKISLRGRTFEGVVISDKMHKTVTVEWKTREYIPKYERYERRRTRVKAHNPKDMNAKIGDYVNIMETRPLSKTKHFIVIEVKNKDQEVKNETSQS
ncbi:MAG: 30S ribosomal protein S17 [DPANN group archaeon]|nr:30S ribosomal protein S17 [DPANN group archaeon]